MYDADAFCKGSDARELHGKDVIAVASPLVRWHELPNQVKSVKTGLGATMIRRKREGGAPRRRLVAKGTA